MGIITKPHHVIATIGNQPSLHRDGRLPLVVAYEPVGKIEWLYTDAMPE
jgi:hypothetical protein